MKKYSILLLATLFCFNPITAQELQANVSVNTPRLQKTDPQVFKELESAITEFLNAQKWTNDEFDHEERIQINIQLNIKEELANNQFKADLIIQSSRPVYGSDYQTVMLSTVDKDILFTYEQFQPIQYSQNSFIDNLSSLLSFYAYIVIGMDYDSFSPFGGDPYFLAAQEIANTIPTDNSGKYKGWRPIDGQRNRYWIIENFLNPRMRPIRQAIYDYHRLGLDIMHEDLETGKNVLINAIQAVKDVKKAQSNSMLVTIFADAKGSEIIEIFKQATPTQKTKIKQLMGKIDPSHASKYRKIGR